MKILLIAKVIHLVQTTKFSSPFLHYKNKKLRAEIEKCVVNPIKSGLYCSSSRTKRDNIFRRGIGIL